MPKDNHQLIKAKSFVNDEYYTKLSDVENELSHYLAYFKNKSVYLPCDGLKSNFWVYFYNNFHKLQLKNLTATHYNSSGRSYKLTYDGITTELTYIQETLDFRSETCTALKNDADIVVTNPPFSLLKEFIPWCKDRDFLVMSSLQAPTYREIFPLISNGSIHAGYTHTRRFLNALGDEQEVAYSIFLTNLPVDKKPLPLTASSHQQQYIDGTNILFIQKLKLIPEDYSGEMAVPVNFIEHHCQGQFEIIDFISAPIVNQRPVFKRLVIKRR